MDQYKTLPNFLTPGYDAKKIQETIEYADGNFSKKSKNDLTYKHILFATGFIFVGLYMLDKKFDKYIPKDD